MVHPFAKTNLVGRQLYLLEADGLHLQLHVDVDVDGGAVSCNEGHLKVADTRASSSSPAARPHVTFAVEHPMAPSTFPQLRI